MDIQIIQAYLKYINQSYPTPLEAIEFTTNSLDHALMHVKEDPNRKDHFYCHSLASVYLMLQLASYELTGDTLEDLLTKLERSGKKVPSINDPVDNLQRIQRALGAVLQIKYQINTGNLDSRYDTILTLREAFKFIELACIELSPISYKQSLDHLFVHEYLVDKFETLGFKTGLSSIVVKNKEQEAVQSS